MNDVACRGVVWLGSERARPQSLQGHVGPSRFLPHKPPKLEIVCLPLLQQSDVVEVGSQWSFGVVDWFGSSAGGTLRYDPSHPQGAFLFRK